MCFTPYMTELPHSPDARDWARAFAVDEGEYCECDGGIECTCDDPGDEDGQ
jgi:hypothetical protein